MTPLPILYFVYMFVGFYFLIITLLIYYKNKTNLNFYPKPNKKYSVSLIVPAYNEELSIVDTIKAIEDIDYPIEKVIIIDDGSKDNTFRVASALKKEYKNLQIITKKNSGKADSINYALKYVKTELVGIVDADSFPAKDSLNKMVGFFNDLEVGAVTPICVPRNNTTFLEKLQVMEYKVIAFTRKLLEYIDSIYVVTGTLGLYRKKALDDIGGFDKNNITEDIEATWHLLKNDWKVKMSFATYTTTIVPDRIIAWYRQRRRWSLGGLQCINKYKGNTLKKNMLGYFVIPFFTFGLFLGLLGIGIFLYLLARKAISSYLLAKYSIETSVPIVTMNDLFITPNILNYFGVVLFVLFFVFNLYVLSIMKDKFLGKQSFFNLLVYMTVYLLVYPIVLITSIWHFYRGKRVWR